MKLFYSFFLALFFIGTLAAQETSIRFETGTYDQALAKAKAEGKYLFIDCYTTWCVPCKMLEKEVFTNKKVTDYFNEKFINMRLDIEKGEGIKLKTRFGIQPVPTLVFINADGEVEHKFIGSSPSDEFLKNASEVFTKANRYGVITRKFKAGQRDPDFMSEYITELIDQSEYAKAEGNVTALLKSSPPEQMCNKNFWPILTNRFIIKDIPEVYPLLIKNSNLIRKNVGDKEYDQKLSGLYINFANTWIFSGLKDYKKKMFDDFRVDIKKASFKNQGEVIYILDLAEIRVKKDLNAFLSMMEKSEGKISDENIYSILINSGFMAKEGTYLQCQRYLKMMNAFIARTHNENYSKRLEYNIGKLQQVKNERDFTLTGKINGQIKDSVTLNYTDASGKGIQSSCSLKSNGTFSFKGKIAEPTVAYLIMKSKVEKRVGDNPNQTTLFLEPANMTFTAKGGAFKDAVITGSKSQAELDVLNKLKAPVDLKMKPFVDAYLNEKDHEKAAEIRDKFDPYNEQKAKIDYEYFEKHPVSYVTAYQLRYRVASLSADKLMYYYNRFTPELKQSAYGKELNDEIKMLKAGSRGSEATDFSTIDINNKPLKLSDFKGKYVLLDFWASWCVPCRKSFPHLLELSHKYNDLEILCISDDDSNPALWKAAIEKDGIGGWHHFLRGFDRKKLMLKEKNENDISTKFGIHTLPTKILIDPSGKIVGRYGGGGENEDAIDKKLAEVFR